MPAKRQRRQKGRADSLPSRFMQINSGDHVGQERARQPLEIFYVSCVRNKNLESYANTTEQDDVEERGTRQQQLQGGAHGANIRPQIEYVGGQKQENNYINKRLRKM